MHLRIISSLLFHSRRFCISPTKGLEKICCPTTKLACKLSTNSNDSNKSKNEQQEKFKSKFESKYDPIKYLMKLKDLTEVILFGFIFTGIYIGYKKYAEKAEGEEKLGYEYVNIPHLKHKLFKCNGYYLPEFTAKLLESIKSFETRKDDIWIVSFPKSGTTWIQEVVFLIINDCDFKQAKASSIESRSPFIDFPSPGIKFIDKMTTLKSRIIKTHLPACFLPSKAEDENKIIYIMRNPKDVCTSYYYFTKLSTQAEYTGNFRDFCEQFIQGTVPYGPWWQHVNDYESKKNTYFIHYEEMHHNPKEHIRALAKFLGKQLNEAQVEAIEKWCSFDQMKANDSVNYNWYKEIGLFRKEGSFFRSGKVGDWLGHFDIDISKKFDDMVEKQIAENSTQKLKINFGINKKDLLKIYNHHNVEKVKKDTN